MRLFLALLFLVLLSVSAQASQLVIVSGGDSLMGCSRDWLFHYLGVTSQGDCTFPASQNSATYLSNGGKIIAKNMGIAGTRLDSGGNPFTTIASTYIAPIVAQKSFVPTGGATALTTRTWVVICGIGSNDGAVGQYTTPANYFAHHADDCAALKAAGFTAALMVTLLPRADGVMTEPNRLAYNTLVTNATQLAAHNIDGFLDIASETTCGNPANLPINTGGTFTGSVSGTTLTVSTTPSVSIPPGSVTALMGTGIGVNVTIQSQLTGTVGGSGTYQVSSSLGTIASEAMSWGNITYFDSDNIHYNDTCGTLIANNVIAPAMRTYFPGIAP